MTEEQFVLWLRGFSDLTNDPPTTDQWLEICNRLKSVVSNRFRSGGSGGYIQPETSVKKYKY